MRMQDSIQLGYFRNQSAGFCPILQHCDVTVKNGYFCLLLSDSRPLQRGSPMASPLRNSPVSFSHSTDADSGSNSNLQYHFTDIAHSKDLVNALKFLRQDEDLCDIVLRVGGTNISAHKVVLSASSPYFKAMFTGELLVISVATLFED